MKKGTKVLMSPKYAKWHLDHPDIYFTFDGKADENYDAETILHLLAVMGESVPGVVGRKGNDCYWVEYKLAGLTASYFVDKKDILVI